jgi:hypothetical protein
MAKSHVTCVSYDHKSLYLRTLDLENFERVEISMHFLQTFYFCISFQFFLRILIELGKNELRKIQI